ncbi:hypothetical protein V6N11_031524 [Hibiscus sabdariffa]|uniref:Uncharacterized protein n=1 Tax=Hibiscus sabdariffa TaxID=183260 RepID=A0ABR2SXX1_9ROSI
MPGRPKHKRRREEGEVENHGPSSTPSAPPSSQTSHVPPSSQIPSPPSSQTSHVPPSSQTSHVSPSSQIPSAPQSAPQSTLQWCSCQHHLSNNCLNWPGRPSQVVLSRPHTRSFTKPTSQPTSTTATSPVAAPVLLSRPHTRSFTKPTSQPTSTTATPPVVAPVSASSGSDATATVSPEERLPKLTIKRHPPKN